MGIVDNKTKCNLAFQGSIGIITIKKGPPLEIRTLNSENTEEKMTHTRFFSGHTSAR